jgi:flagellar hook-associated protein 1 FlgK
MAGLFEAISLAKRSLMAQQWAMNTAAHNVANVNTPGYTRQRTEIEAFNPALEVEGGFLGMGSNVIDIARMRNRYLDRQVLRERQNQGFLQFQNTALSQVETILGETSGYGISGVLDEFWAAWSDLANDPENSAARTELQQRGQQLSTGLNNLDNDLKDQQKQLDSQLSSMVDQINQLAAQIAALNESISASVNQGTAPNDLMDQRDLLIDQLSQLTNVEVQDEDNGTITVWLGGQILVYSDISEQLSLKSITGSEAKLHQIVWAANGNSVNFQSGQVAGLLLVRDEVIPELLSGLDEFTLALVQQVNTLHSTGYTLAGDTGIDFFHADTTGAGDIALSTEVAQDADNIAASADGTPGNNEIALAIFNLQNELVMEDGTSSLGGYYAELAADLGALVQTSEDELYESETAMQQLENWQSSEEGVSLDEEMANMIKYQQTYTAIAQFMSSIDQMLDVIINL